MEGHISSDDCQCSFWCCVYKVPVLLYKVNTIWVLALTGDESGDFHTSLILKLKKNHHFMTNPLYIFFSSFFFKFLCAILIQEVNIEYTFLQETVFLNTQGYVHLYIYFLVFRLYLCYIKILRCEFRVRLFRMQWFSIFTHSHTCIIILNGWKLRQNPQLV